MSKTKFDAAMAAFDELQMAKDAFDAAITKFSKVYQPKSLSLSEWSEDMEITMLDLYEDIESTLGEE